MRELIGKRFKVLDQGFIEVMDFMGGEGDIVEAARVTAQTVAKTFDDDVSLLRYLMRHTHSTPYEMVELKLRVYCPMDTWRQWIRHRTANVNEYSTRYSEAIDHTQVTAASAWRKQAESNRQGSDGNIDPKWRLADAGISMLPDEARDAAAKALSADPLITVGQYLVEREKQTQTTARAVYEERLQFGVAREQARKDLPLSTYTASVWKIDGHNLLHFLGLRMDEHAQYEIRQYANVIGHEIVAKWLPNVWQAFNDYRLRAIKLTALDISVVQRLAEIGRPAPYRLDDFMLPEVQPYQWFGKKRCRERDECLTKLVRLGLIRVTDEK